MLYIHHLIHIIIGIDSTTIFQKGKLRVQLNHAPHNQKPIVEPKSVGYLLATRVLVLISDLPSSMDTPETTSAKIVFNPPSQGSPSPNFPNLAKLWNVVPAFDVSVTLLFQGLW